MITLVNKKIKNIRELKNYTQEYVAQKLDISTRAYSKIESGETNLTIDRLNRISQILEMSPLEILEFDDKKVFNHCKQDGNIGINQYLPKDIINQYEKQVSHLKSEIVFLRSLLKENK